MLLLAELYLYIFPLIAFLYGTWFASTSGFWSFVAFVFFFGMWIIVAGATAFLSGRWQGFEFDDDDD